MSIATNITTIDGPRILNVLPNWLNTFNNLVDEIIIVYDKKPIEGRIRSLHNKLNDFQDSSSYLNRIKTLDNRITVVELDYDSSPVILKQWFTGNDIPIRCQSGTPIFAFIYAIQKAKSNLVFKVDCDMVFYNNGFVDKAINMLENDNIDLIEPPRLKTNFSKYFSTRAFFINRKSLNKKLPIKAHKLDLLRRIHRTISKRPSYLSLEQMLQIEIDCGKVISTLISTKYGNSMHISTLEEMKLPIMSEIIEKFGKGLIPEYQKLNSDNFDIKYWKF